MKNNQYKRNKFISLIQTMELGILTSNVKNQSDKRAIKEGKLIQIKIQIILMKVLINSYHLRLALQILEWEFQSKDCNNCSRNLVN